jgi:hypothetical protein
VNKQELIIKKEIDKARLLQSFYQEAESANIILEYENHFGLNEF